MYVSEVEQSRVAQGVELAVECRVVKRLACLLCANGRQAQLYVKEMTLHLRATQTGVTSRVRFLFLRVPCGRSGTGLDDLRRFWGKLVGWTDECCCCFVADWRDDVVWKSCQSDTRTRTIGRPQGLVRPRHKDYIEKRSL